MQHGALAYPTACTSGTNATYMCIYAKVGEVDTAMKVKKQQEGAVMMQYDVHASAYDRDDESSTHTHMCVMT